MLCKSLSNAADFNILHTARLPIVHLALQKSELAVKLLSNKKKYLFSLSPAPYTSSRLCSGIGMEFSKTLRNWNWAGSNRLFEGRKRRVVGCFVRNQARIERTNSLRLWQEGLLEVLNVG